MTATCHSLPPSVAQEMLETAARAICDRSGESAAQRDSRTRQMVHLALAMQPRDGLEHMLSILAAGHFNLILDSMREVFQSPQDTANVRAKSTIVALDRSLLGFVRELRISQKRPSANPTAEERMTSQPPAPAQPPPSHGRGVESPLPVLKTGQGAAAATNPPPAAPAKAMPLPRTAPSLPGKTVLHHPQTANQHLAAFEEALAVGALRAHAREKENAGIGG